MNVFYKHLTFFAMKIILKESMYRGLQKKIVLTDLQCLIHESANPISTMTWFCLPLYIVSCLPLAGGGFQKLLHICIHISGYGLWFLLMKEYEGELVPFTELDRLSRPLLPPFTTLAARTNVLLWAQSR